VAHLLVAMSLVLSPATVSGANVLRTQMRDIAADSRQTQAPEIVQKGQGLHGWIARTAGATRAKTLSMVHWARAEVSQPLKEVEVHVPFRRMVMSASIWFVLSMLIAFFYRSQKELPQKMDDAEKVDPKDEFINGHFNCFQDKNTCLMSFCCSGIRWADTMSMAGLLGFWVALVIYQLFAGLNAVFPALGFGVLLLVMCVYFRQALRTKLDMPRGSVVTVLQDFLFYCCCPCCAIAQEARVVEQAWQVQHKMVDGVVP